MDYRVNIKLQGSLSQPPPSHYTKIIEQAKTKITDFI